MSLYDKMGLLITPNGVAQSKIFAYKPTNGSGDGVFDRNTTATRVNSVGLIENVAIDMARIDYPTNGSCPHLLFEPQSTNLIKYSEDFNTGWNGQNGNVSDGGIGLFYLSPLSNVIKYEATSNPFNQFFYQLPSSVSSGSTYTMSGYIKSNDTPYIHFQVHPVSSSTFIVWDNDNKNVISSSAGIDSFEITSLSDGWVKAEITFTAATSVPHASLKTYLSTSPTNGLSGVSVGVIAYQTFVQLEALPYATSYIPTNGSAVTRVQDVANNFGDVNTFNSEEGVLFVEMAALDNDLTDRSISLSSGYYDNRIELRYNSTSNGVRVFGVVGGFYQFDSGSSINLTDITNQSKIALKYKQNDFALWVNGFEVYSDLLGSTFGQDVLNTLNFSDAQGSSPLYGKIKQVQVYKEALTDAELEYLTTYATFPDLANANNYNLILNT